MTCGGMETGAQQAAGFGGRRFFGSIDSIMQIDPLS
jgi:hypothetical protein